MKCYLRVVGEISSWIHHILIYTIQLFLSLHMCTECWIPQGVWVVGRMLAATAASDSNSTVVQCCALSARAKCHTLTHCHKCHCHTMTGALLNLFRNANLYVISTYCTYTSQASALMYVLIHSALMTQKYAVSCYLSTSLSYSHFDNTEQRKKIPVKKTSPPPPPLLA